MSQTMHHASTHALAVDAPLDPAALAEVRYAIDNGFECAKTMANHLARRMHPFPDLSGLRVAELGTPNRFGPMLVCRAFGAEIAAINTHFVKWSEGSPAFLRALARVGAEEYPEADWSFIDDVLAAGSYESPALALHTIASLSGPLAIDDASFDCIVSNAILNQVDLPSLLPELCRITRPNGFGIHQVDFRDSRDYARPLEFLTFADEAVAKERAAGRWTRGNRLRPDEMRDLFRKVGFRVEHFGPNLLAEEGYLASLRPRLAPRFAAMRDEQLRPISGRFYLRAITDAQVREDVEYAVRVADEYVQLICGELGRRSDEAMPLAPPLNGRGERSTSRADRVHSVAGLRLLELGPGRHFGTPLILHAFGARVAVLDKYLADWDEVYHPRFYRFLREAVGAKWPRRDWSSLDRIINAADHLREIIAQDRTDLAEPPSGYADASFDVIVSNAVLEHVGDVPKTAAEMARLTAPGGINIHQVDFRDHRDFSRPLEFLTMPDDAYRRLFDEMMNGNGNRVRHEAMGEDFRRSGFEVRRFDANIWAPAEHLAEVRPRLQPRFAALSDAQLAVVSGRFFLKRLGEGPIAKKVAAIDLTDDRWAVEGALDEHVRYAIVNGVYYASAVAQQFGRGAMPGSSDHYSKRYGVLPDLRGLSILELGPGPNFGTMLLCRACGAQVAVFDKYLAQWDAKYHPHFYRALKRECESHFPYADWSGLDRIIEASRHDESIIRAAAGDLAEPPCSFDDASFDAIVSNAVLEHIGDTAAMAGELARLTRPGGVGVHQVDFRDHRAQDRPLTFLTIPEESAAQTFLTSRNSQGNRVRPHELASDFAAAGFVVESVEPNMFASPEHLAEVRAHLIDRFAAMSDEQLMIVSARFFVRRSGAERGAGADDAIARVFAQPRADEAAAAAAGADGDEFTDVLNDQVGYCLRNAIDYAYCIGRHFGRFSGELPDFAKVTVLDDIPDLTGLSVLELGPGRNFGSMVICQALGARVAVLDKYLAKWDPSYHPRFYAGLRAAAARRLPRAKWDGLAAIVAAGRHLREIIAQHACDLAAPPSDLPDNSFDVIVSNAVLEHVGDTYLTACELARLTRTGGLGVHQVDFRDHQNFDRPYDFLRYDDEEYRRIFLRSRNENGNRVRSHELVEDFRRAGFSIDRVDENLLGTPEQLAAARPLLSARFAAMSDEQLLVLSSRIFVRRTAQPAPTESFERRRGIGSFVRRLVGGA